VTVGGARTPDGEARRAVVEHERALVIDLITLTLNHGVFAVRAASSLAEAKAILEDWVPNMSVVHVDHRELRAPLVQDRLRLGEAARGPDDEAAVVQGQRDEVHDERAIVEHERAACFASW